MKAPGKMAVCICVVHISGDQRIWGSVFTELNILNLINQFFITTITPKMPREKDWLISRMMLSVTNTHEKQTS